MIKVLFFAQLAESAGVREWSGDFLAGEDVKALADRVLLDLPDSLAEELYDGTVMVAVNKVRADWSATLQSGDEVAFLPPFSGG